ncbi:ParA family protein [Microbacterium invictum]|uniref:MinD-like ATPase involved in chromosome partitioning or flagellar assembly n=1 Tax=Microbacterium invictum TaxID=515415 RepID=A0AA40SQX1_9MICO|nr:MULTISPECIES: ParA family protein [Microbacterium]MBB4140782.1 MinD-like ATPase involved in chromosome partitioning or flagellar assembly [Microbacterium invictum]
MTLTEHPRTYATVTDGVAIFTAPDGRREHVAGGDGDIRQAIIRRATDEARRTGGPVELVTSGDRGDHHLLVTGDGALTAVEKTARADATGAVPAASELPASAPDTAPTAATRRGSHAAVHPVEQERISFISDPGPAVAAQSGWRGLLARLGVPVERSAYETARAGWVDAVSRHWAGCRTIAVVNGKGGVGKTMTTAMLAAVYARHGGGNVLAWDNNDTRGTLGWRTETGLYDTTVRDLLPRTDDLLAPTAGISDIARYVHHQGADRYDVLRSNPELLATDQRLDGAQFDLLRQVGARYYRLVVFDSGNDESADRWIRMIDSTGQLVLSTLAAPESAESAALLLEALRGRDERSAALAENAVVVVTQSEPAEAGTVRTIAAGFDGLVRAVETVPFDPALKSGQLRFDNLRPATKDAWLRVAAAAADGL